MNLSSLTDFASGFRYALRTIKSLNYSRMKLQYTRYGFGNIIYSSQKWGTMTYYTLRPLPINVSKILWLILWEDCSASDFQIGSKKKCIFFLMFCKALTWKHVTKFQHLKKLPVLPLDKKTPWKTAYTYPIERL